MDIYSWNVNGIRAIQKKGFVEWVSKESPDILCIQETKAQIEQLEEKLTQIDGYKSYFFSAEKKGYSGVAVYTKVEPLNVRNMDIEEFDFEGRYIELEYKNFNLINCYFPNSQSEGKRLDYKLRFNNAIMKRCDELVELGKNIILCGDLNVAHKEIDLTNPKRNEKNPGYLPEERGWMTEFLASGYVDTFRYIQPEETKYSWWSYRFKSREKNIGWRIDYHIVNESFVNNIEDAMILNNVMGSDHCPVVLRVSVK
ncbi:MAG: exodeoxyribonuclease III [Psychrilyobacter sp.]|uniref:exodeoxyribonuclease III n=1 Tax=Psychrilyobacter sp. TaxID=2586924 RepID=UPI003C78382C